jgi:hypothetical protein
MIGDFLPDIFRICEQFAAMRIQPIKGIVQRDLTGVESRLKRSALINYLVALVHFFNLKGHSCERSKKPVSAS